jgi:hypothetical protein
LLSDDDHISQRHALHLVSLVIQPFFERFPWQEPEHHIKSFAIVTRVGNLANIGVAQARNGSSFFFKEAYNFGLSERCGWMSLTVISRRSFGL